jgi:iron complex outermembrane receptor protein
MSLNKVGSNRFLPVLAAVWVMPLLALAQGNGVLKGKVVNAATKNAAADVVVTASSPALGQERIVVTDAGGTYTLRDLPGGTYTVRFEKPRYNPFSRGNINVREGATVTFNVELVPEAGLVGEEIVVTGSRIPRIEVETAAPVSVVTRSDIQTAGQASIGEILQRLPDQTGADNTQTNNGGDGAVRIDLRGLGTERTLVLLNGRRVVAGGTGANDSVDLNTIPTQAIQRIEILKDGASAIYGSDAIAGVVNIITRKDFTGNELGVYAGTSQRADGTLLDANFTTGTSNERGNILFSAAFTGQQEAWAGDRPFSRIDKDYDYNGNRIITLGSTSIPAGRFAVVDEEGEPLPASASNAQFWKDLRAQYPTATAFTFGCPSPFNELEAPAGPCDPLERVFRPYRSVGLNEAGGDQYNYQPQNYLLTPMRRINVFSTGTLNLGAGIDGFFEASYTNRQSNQRLAPEPLGTAGEGLVVSADNFYNPFGMPMADVRRRLVEFNNRIFAQDLDTFRIVGGVNGGGDLGGRRWIWDLSLNYGRTQGVETKRGLLHLSRLEGALGPTFLDPEDGTLRCGTPDAPIEGCVPFDVFHGPGSITPEMIEWVTYTGTARGFNQQIILSANVTADLVRIGNAHSPVAVAIGAEHRREAGTIIPDPLTAKGDTTGNKEAETTGAYFSNEGYLEISLPLLARPGPGPGDLLSLSAASRVVDFTTFGTNFTYKVGARVSPFPDATLRGTFSTAFRAPAINELFQGTIDSFPTATDPCSDRTPGSRVDEVCTEQGVPPGFSDERVQLNSPITGSTDLKPETAKVFTVGLVLQPRWVKNLSLTVDYYNINIRNAIRNVTADVILSSCYPRETGAPSQYCDRITRLNTPGVPPLIDRIDDRLTNVGGDRVSGIDFAADYEPTTPYGTFGFTATLTYLANFQREFAGGLVVQGRDTYDLNRVLPDWKGNLGFRWGMSALSAGVNLRWINGYRECEDNACTVRDSTAPPPMFRNVKPYAAVDLNVGFKLPRATGLNSSILAGVNNVFDREPVYVNNGFLAGSDETAYDYIGRYFYVRLSHQFN